MVTEEFVIAYYEMLSHAFTKGLRKPMKTSIITAGVEAEIRTRNFQKTKLHFYPPHRNVLF
jgi:hypothetical protein